MLKVVWLDYVPRESKCLTIQGTIVTNCTERDRTCYWRAAYRGSPMSPVIEHHQFWRGYVYVGSNGAFR